MDTKMLKELGLTNAAEKIETGRSLKKKLAVAYEYYKFVSPDIFDRFAKSLREKTYKNEKTGKYTGIEKWHELKFIALDKYPEVPPPDCLLELKKAKELGIFDGFEVAKTEEVSSNYNRTPVPDPIIFGLINGCVDKFFITQWDDDVRIEDILKDNEG